MLERLLEALFQAKSGVFAGLFLIGTTGVLVSATVTNGVTTITLTQASPSASASPSATASHSASPSVSPTAKPSSSPSSSAKADGCSAQAREAAAQVQRVNRAFSQFHTDLAKLERFARTESQKDTLEKADKQLKSIRQNAVEAIHATVACKDDEDKDEDADKDEAKDNDTDKDEDKDAAQSESNPLLALLQKLFGHNVTVTTTTSASPSASPTAATSASPKPSASATVSGDAKTIADNAIAAMQLVFDAAKGQVPAPSANATRPARTPEHTARPSHSPSASGERD